MARRKRTTPLDTPSTEPAVSAPAAANDTPPAATTPAASADTISLAEPIIVGRAPAGPPPLHAAPAAGVVAAGGPDEEPWAAALAARRPAKPETGDPAYGPNPFPVRSDRLAGVRLLEDRRYRQVQIRFDDKPSEAVREAVREAGFQWRQQEQAWTRRIDPEHGWRTRADAAAVFERVAAMVREEKGVGQEVS